MSQAYQELVSQFKTLMERGDKDQWKLAELAFLASENHGGMTQFAKDVGYAANTIRTYKNAWTYRESASNRGDLTFADAVTLGKYSEDKAAAVQVLAGAMGASISTTAKDTEAVQIVQDFLTENPELVKDALKDDDTRSAVASAAYKAATEDVVAEAEGVTKEAAKTKVPQGKSVGMKSVEIQRLKLDVTRAARENGLLATRWARDFEALSGDMSQEEIAYIDEQLGLMMVKTGEMRTFVRTYLNVNA